MMNKHGNCTKCQSDNLVKNGHNGSGKQQYHCKDCGAYRIFESEKKYNETRKGEIIRTYFERASLRGLERIFHVSRQTVSEWLKKNNRKSSLN
jgi:transposase-like protein